MLDHNLVLEARDFLKDRIAHTPLRLSVPMSDRVGAEVHLKLEFLQITGSFKIRGALFGLSRLSPSERQAGVATCSAGNHGKGIAHAARGLSIPATIYVPRSVDRSKEEAMVAMGATVVRSGYDGYDDTEEWALEQAARSGRLFVSAFDDDCIMAGNGGSLACEVLEDLPAARTFIVPVGGGGLSGG